jgi:hypothetical protein
MKTKSIVPKYQLNEAQRDQLLAMSSATAERFVRAREALGKMIYLTCQI